MYDLDDMIIPFEMPVAPNRWNTMVNDSQVLMRSHKEAADHIEAIAASALQASKQTFTHLIDFLMDNSTEEYIGSLTKQITQMKQWKETLEAQLNETESAQRVMKQEDVVWSTALGNLTSSLRQLAPAGVNTSAQSDQIPLNHMLQSNQTTKVDLEKKIKDMDHHLEIADGRISEIHTGVKHQVQTANDKLQMANNVAHSINELKTQAFEAKITALSSVVSGKEVESEEIALHRGLEYMVKEWPRQQLQTKAVLKKERPLREKVLADVKRKLVQVEEMIKPALENSSEAANISHTAEQIAESSVRESKSLLSQAKHTRTASAHLSSHIDSAVLRLAEQEMLSQTSNSQLFSEPEESLNNIKENMKLAKIQLEAYSATLTELISKIDGSIPLEHFNSILNKTAQRLSMLRKSVESPALTLKIQKLNSAAKEQQSRLSVIEQDISEITEERDSLTDIALNLPQSCAHIFETAEKV